MGGDPGGGDSTVAGVKQGEFLGLVDVDQFGDEFVVGLVTELINIYEAEELTLFHSGDG